MGARTNTLDGSPVDMSQDCTTRCRRRRSQASGRSVSDSVSAVQSIQFVVNGDPALARDTASQILAERGFTLNWASEWSAQATKGSTAGMLLIGGLAQRFRVGLSVTSVGNGQSMIEFTRENTGWTGGAIGAVRVKRNMEALRDHFRDAMTARGMLAGVQER